MIEKVNPSHPDKIADRIAGAIVDLAYKLQEDPKVAVEVLIGHCNAKIIIESSVVFNEQDLFNIVYRIAGNQDMRVEVILAKQDEHLADNQVGKIRCGDNGIFKGMPITKEQKTLSDIAKIIYDKFPSDGKYILADDTLIICQSNASSVELKSFVMSNLDIPNIVLNPLGEWTGGTSVDTGATNRKLGSDMGDGVTGGGLHGKDLSKADVSVNIYVHLKAQETGKPVEMYCAIGDESVNGIPYSEIVSIAKEYINNVGGFEKFAEWGLL